METFKDLPAERVPQEEQTYLPPQTKQADFAAFWQQTLWELATIPLNIKREKQEYPSRYFTIEEISYDSLYQEKIVGWYIYPTKRTDPMPCVIEYLGYMVNRGEPFQYFQWAQLDVAVLVFDVRGQGGATADQAPYPAPTMNFPIGKGLLQKENGYQRRIYCDSVRAIEVAKQLPEIDSSKLILSGASQGGALSLAAAALSNEKIAMVMADVPSNCDIENRIAAETGSYQEIAHFLRKYPDLEAEILKNQSYFDLKNFAAQILAPVYASVGGKDPICPAHNFFALYNRLPGEKYLSFYPYNYHDGGGNAHCRKKLQLLQKIIQQE